MFKKQTLLTFGILLPILGIWIFQMTFMRSSDLEAYKKMIKERAIASSEQGSSTNQQRIGVSKDIWFSQDDSSRLHYQIASKSSTLTLTPIGNKFEIVETLDGIQCWMQDKLFTDTASLKPMQQTRFIEAETGHYRYTTQEFKADNVALSLFRLPGHSLPKKNIDQKEAFLRGKAHDISFLFSGKTPQFQAKQFQATVVKE